MRHDFCGSFWYTIDSSHGNNLRTTPARPEGSPYIRPPVSLSFGTPSTVGDNFHPLGCSGIIGRLLAELQVGSDAPSVWRG